MVGQQNVHEPEIGSTLGEYQLISRLGDGGMGVVYKALYLPTGKVYALKWFRPNRANPYEIYKVFIRCSVLDHPGVVRFRDIGEKSSFLVMDLVEGIALRWRLKQIKTLPFNQLLELGLSLCDSVQTLHNAGVLHRDIRAVNIYLTQTGPVLIDIGVPYQMDRLEMRVVSFAKSGPASFIAPEVLTQHASTVRSDIYSLAAVLYRALTGKRPARDQTGAHLPRPAIEIGKSEALLRILRVGLAQAPECRFSTINTMACALESVKKNSLVVAD